MLQAGVLSQASWMCMRYRLHVYAQSSAWHGCSDGHAGPGCMP